MDPVKSEPSADEEYRPPKSQQIYPSLYAYHHPSGNPIATQQGLAVRLIPITVDPSRPIQYHQQKMPDQQEHVPDYMGLSIFTTLFCCCCLGIFAAIASNKANYMKLSKPKEAKEKAQLAKNLNILALICGIAIYIFCIVYLRSRIM